MNISRAVSSGAPQPEAHRSCPGARTESCQRSPASQGSSGEQKEGFSHRFTFLLLFTTSAAFFFTLVNTLSCLSCSEMCRVRLCPREGTKGQGVQLQACKASRSHHRPGMNRVGTGEILGFCGMFAYIYSKHSHSRNSYSNLFPCTSYGDAWFKNKCAFWCETAGEAKCIIIPGFQR